MRSSPEPSASWSGIIAFLQTAERLKSTRRSAWTATGEPETVAAHSWRLTLLALILEDQFPEIRMDHVVRMLIVHDLGEALHGDIPAPEQGAESKAATERRDLVEVIRPLPPAVADGILELWDEYESCQTPEARLAKGLDKLETIMQHNQGVNPENFDYRFNLGYGRRFTSDDPRLAALRELLDHDTLMRAAASGRSGPDTK
jgi:putative hydrolase of HD superfamily